MNSSEQKIRNLSHDIMHRLQKFGASDVEVYVNRGEARSVSVRNGELDLAENAAGNDVSVRAYVGKKSAATRLSFDETADYSRELEELVLTAQSSPEDPFSGLPSPEELQHAEARDFDQFDTSPLLSMDDLKARAQALEAAAGGEDIVVDQSECSHAKGETFYCASNGFDVYKEQSHAAQGVVAIHQGQELVRDYASSAKIYLEDIEDVEETGKRAFDRVWAARNPKRGPSGVFPVIFDERVASSLISHLLSAMNASSIARRSSWLIDYEEAIFPQDWKIIETPFRMRKRSSSVYDAQGRLKKEQAIVSNGRPEFWLSDWEAARQLDETSSGHAVRAGVNTSIAVRSLRLEGEIEDRQKILKDIGEGMMVTGFIGATINPHTGDYSRGANGFWIRNGEIAEAVNELTIAYNLKAMLPQLRAANDADEDRNFVVPSLSVGEMTIAGS